ncbi:MAG: hypothetical protein N2C14_03795 [Planctomycetales bacterium]
MATRTEMDAINLTPIIAAQNGHINRPNGRYIQRLRGGGFPLDRDEPHSSDSGAFNAAHPDVEVSDYQAPGDPDDKSRLGFEIILNATEGGTNYRRVGHYAGPETWREQGWIIMEEFDG